MRMYELWKRATPEQEPRRLEDAGGPVLFERPVTRRRTRAEDRDRWEARFTIVPVTVGRA